MSAWKARYASWKVRMCAREAIPGTRALLPGSWKARPAPQAPAPGSLATLPPERLPHPDEISLV